MGSEAKVTKRDTSYCDHHPVTPTENISLAIRERSNTSTQFQGTSALPIGLSQRNSVVRLNLLHDSRILGPSRNSGTNNTTSGLL